MLQLADASKESCWRWQSLTDAMELSSLSANGDDTRSSDISQSRLASCEFVAEEDGEASLQSAKYFPETPRSLWCVAT
jgi:hypothetical protein